MAVIFQRLLALELALSDSGLQPIELALSPDAHELWVAYYNRHGQEQAELTGDLASAWSKLEAYAARLSMLHHLTRVAADDPSVSDPLQIDAVSLSAGVALSDWFGHEARRVYAVLAEPDGEADDLLQWIERRGGCVSPREVQMNVRSLREPGAAESALDRLAKAGRGTWHDLDRSDKGGRPSRVFQMSTCQQSTKPHETR